MNIDVLNSKRYNIGNGIYIIVSFNDNNRLVEILTTFSFECTFSTKQMVFIIDLNTTWSKMLSSGTTTHELIDQLTLSDSEYDEYIENMILILEKEGNR